MESQTIGSIELGRLFEQATFKILGEMFRRWGCEVHEARVQRSGTQHGFDVFYRIASDGVSLNVFVECKASQTYNKIRVAELVEKVHHLSWAGFPAKDIHLFFSPSRSIEFDNQTLTIEDNSHSFVIVDWMPKAGGSNLAMELFAAYRSWGTDSDILNYCSYLFSQVDSQFASPRTFEEICGQLRTSFQIRLAEHSAGSRLDGYRIINGAFWKQIRDETHSEYLHYYYTKADSTPVRLREAIATNYSIRNQGLESGFERLLSQAIRSKSALIKILSRGGEGKSTFLYQIARNYYHDYLVVWLETTDVKVLSAIESQARRATEDRPLLILLDNLSTYDRLVDFSQALAAGFRRRPFALVVAERDFRYEKIEDVSGFEASFNETYLLEYRSHRIREQVFDKLASHLQAASGAGGDVKEIFLADGRKSLTERTFSVLKHLKATNRLGAYRFDWDDWAHFTSENAPSLARLYLVLATFFQFGFAIDIAFCARFLKNADETDIKTVLGDNSNLPIYRRGERLLLRHETTASWYLDGTSPETLVNQENSTQIFQEFLRDIDTPFARDLFIWLCIKNRDFRSSYLAKYVSDNERAAILAEYIEAHPSELKSRTELSKIYQRQKRWQEAEEILLKLKELDPDNLQARTELSKIYQRQKKWQEAEDILLEELRIYPGALHPRTELSKIYQRQERWQEAEDILLECLQINSDDLDSRTELSKIYQRQKRWQEAEDILLEALKIAPGALHPRTELSKIYQRQKRWQEAEEILLKLKELDPDNLQARTELSKIYQRQKRWQEAEDVLLECLGINFDDLDSRTELSKIYQRQGKLDQGQRLLRECQSINPEDVNSLLELGKICSRDPLRYEEAEGLFQQLLSIEEDSLYGRIELASLYRKTRRWGEREQILFDIFDTHPDDIPTLMALAEVFKRFRKYRVAVRLLESALELRRSDLITLSELAKVYSIVRANRFASGCLEKGRTIIVKDPYHKHADRFAQLELHLDEQVELISLNRMGILGKEEGRIYILADGARYLPHERATVNYKSKSGDKVFFATYHYKGQLIVDFIEPYFENLDHLDQLK